jgi:tetratricopeptide (TPR) repeat protein
MELAVRVFDNQDEDLKKAKDEMLLIKVRFFTQFASIYFIKGEYQKAKDYIEQAYSICSDPTNYTYETAESFKKSLTEVEQLRFKCEAKIRGVSCLSLKEKNPSE